MIRSTHNGSSNQSFFALEGLSFEAELSLQRLTPRLTDFWDSQDVTPELRREFELRLEHYWPELFELLLDLYGTRYDCFYHLEQILLTAAATWANRPETLREVDRHRVNEPDWFQSEKVVGGALYVDLFSENLGKLRESIDYFKQLGLTYLHLMPLSGRAIMMAATQSAIIDPSTRVWVRLRTCVCWLTSCVR